MRVCMQSMSFKYVEEIVRTRGDACSVCTLTSVLILFNFLAKLFGYLRVVDSNMQFGGIILLKTNIMMFQIYVQSKHGNVETYFG